MSLGSIPAPGITVPPGQVPVSFDDVAVYFSLEEWRHLEEWQKTLYAEVMEENLEIFLSLEDIFLHCDDIRENFSTFHSNSVRRKVQGTQRDNQITEKVRDHYKKYARGVLEDLHHKCSQCHEDFTSWSLLIDHKIDHHRPWLTAEETIPNPQNQRFKQQRHLDTQYFSLRDLIQATCTIQAQDDPKKVQQELTRCHKVPSNSEGKKFPPGIQQSETEKSQCVHFSQVFTDHSLLGEHEKSHKENKSFTCPDCGKTFIRKSILKLHQRTHTGERPYACTDCGKCFSQRFNLVIHQRIHTGEKPYRCPTCEKSFRYKPALVRHEKEGKCAKSVSKTQVVVESKSIRRLPAPTDVKLSVKAPRTSPCSSLQHSSHDSVDSKLHLSKLSKTIKNCDLQGVKDSVTSPSSLHHGAGGEDPSTSTTVMSPDLTMTYGQSSIKTMLAAPSLACPLLGNKPPSASPSSVYKLSSRQKPTVSTSSISHPLNTKTQLTQLASSFPRPTIFSPSNSYSFNTKPPLASSRTIGHSSDPKPPVASPSTISKSPLVSTPSISHSLDAKLPSASPSSVNRLLDTKPPLVSSSSMNNLFDTKLPLVSSASIHHLLDTIPPLVSTTYINHSPDTDLSSASFSSITHSLDTKPLPASSSSIIHSVDTKPPSALSSSIIPLVGTKLPPTSSSSIIHSLDTKPSSSSIIPFVDTKPPSASSSSINPLVYTKIPSASSSLAHSLYFKSPFSSSTPICSSSDKKLTLASCSLRSHAPAMKCLSSKPPYNICQLSKNSPSPSSNSCQKLDLKMFSTLSHKVSSTSMMLCPQASHMKHTSSNYDASAGKYSSLVHSTNHRSSVNQPQTKHSLSLLAASHLPGTKPSPKSTTAVGRLTTSLAALSPASSHCPIDKPFPCSQCKKTFVHLSQLTEHQKSHTGSRNTCPECNKTFIRKSTLILHKRTHTGERPFACTECGRRFSQRFNLVVHQRIHTGENPYVCTECHKSFRYRTGLLRHQKHGPCAKKPPIETSPAPNLHLAKSNPTIHRSLNSPPASQGSCRVSSSDVPNLSKNLRREPPQERWQGIQCKAPLDGHLKSKKALFSIFGNLSRKRSSRLASYKVNISVEPLVTEEPFNGTNTLYSTLRSSVKPSLVSHCHISTYPPAVNQANHRALKSALLKGTEIENVGEKLPSLDNQTSVDHSKKTDKKQYKCEHCKDCFSQLEKYVEHQEVHTSGRHRCSMCSKVFGKASQLVVHQRTHTGEKPYSCGKCDKQFSQKFNLVVHQRIHTGEKPFICTDCNRAFRYRTGLLKHKKYDLCS
ncbi:zinc finger protein Xfin-like isoform X2 [Dendropsophus ebraccatus]|uniref:zinc finger protein Xfin-like isoform X2 n=1 Tax=Dendropsophus ebraccatus TaxID=150705 RepID=UPI0038315F71